MKLILSNRYTIGTLFIVIIAGFAVYANSISGNYIWDDYGLIKENSCISSWRNIGMVFIRDMGLGTPDRSSFYRPLQMLVNMADYSFWGLWLQGYHITNIILHCAAALAFLWFVQVLSSNYAVALCASLLFLIHPVQTEAVAYVSGRSDPLSAFFIFLCLALYVKSRVHQKRYWLASSLACYALALLSKENAIIAPLLIVLVNTLREGKLLLKKTVPFLAAVAAYGGLRLLVARFQFPPIVSSSVITERVPGFFASIAEYVRILFLPTDLHLSHDFRLFAFTDPLVLAGITLTVLLVSLAWIKRGTVISFAIAWFFIALIPVANVYPVSHTYMMVHWIYLPLAGFCIAGAHAVVALLQRGRCGYVFRVMAVLIMSLYAAVTIRQNSFWAEPEKLFLRSLFYSPDNWIFLNELALEYMNKGAPFKAIPLYERALAINPGASGIYYNLSKSYYLLGRYQESIGILKKALEINPSDQRAAERLSRIHQALKKREEGK
jgi:tetratricopeptide (TPR) repeat protein